MILVLDQLKMSTCCVRLRDSTLLILKGVEDCASPSEAEQSTHTFWESFRKYEWKTAWCISRVPRSCKAASPIYQVSVYILTGAVREIQASISLRAINWLCLNLMSVGMHCSPFSYWSNPLSSDSWTQVTVSTSVDTKYADAWPIAWWLMPYFAVCIGLAALFRYFCMHNVRVTWPQG